MDDPIHKGIFSYVHLLPPTTNFPVMIYPAQVVWPLYSVFYSLPRPFSIVRFEECIYVCVIAFYATPEFPISVRSFDMQIWLLSSAPCLSHLSVPLNGSQHAAPYSRIRLQGTCRLNFWYYYFSFWIFALWNVVPSRPFSPCSWLDPPSLNHCVGLFLSIYNYSLPVLRCPLTNNSVDILIWRSWSELPYFNSDLFSSHWQPPTPLACPDFSTIFLCLHSL